MEAHMDRRKFLKMTAVAGIGMAIPGNLFHFVRNIEAAEGADLIVAKGSSPAQTTRAALEALGGMKRFIAKGDVVVVKPNIGWDRTPEYAATTNPDVVGTVIKLCYEAGAKKVKVFDHTVNNAKRCYTQSGIFEAARVSGAEISYIDDRRFRDVPLNGIALKSWPLYSDILEADKVINIPIAKTHGLAGLTLSMKNWMGVMGGSRGRIHQRLDESLVDVAKVIRPALTVLDAVRILTAGGPQGGNLSNVKILNTIVIGTDQVAVDSYGATLFGMKGSDLGVVRLAHKAGLGRMDLSGIKIKRIHI
jgi:uncharacterized protein (DUF362 family)